MQKGWRESEGVWLVGGGWWDGMRCIFGGGKELGKIENRYWWTGVWPLLVLEEVGPWQ